MRVIIIDDEKKAIRSIELIIGEYCPDLEIVGRAKTALDGIKEIQAKKPDLVFLDIEMPHGSGFDLLESLPERNFDVIFVTAFNNYAIKAFKCSAVDYILKPININELVEAVKRVIAKRKANPHGSVNYDLLFSNLKSGLLNKLTVPSSDGLIYINIDDIVRVEAERSYCYIFTTDGDRLMVSKSLLDVETQINNPKFFRSAPVFR
ncbi:MAG: response regulator transcription factor [Bacteroidia bacterium]|nr:response regulator transcription factor [Bacteroidia bacterium]